LAVKNPEPVRSSDFDEMLATGLVPMGIIREGCRRDAELLRHIGEHRRAGLRPLPAHGQAISYIA
jgi:hypothetical protein